MTATPEVPEVIAKPSGVVFVAVTIGACLAVAALIRRIGDRLPLPSYVVDLIGDDGEDDDSGWTDTADTDEYTSYASPSDGGFAQ